MPPGAVPPGIWTNGMTLRSAITRYGSRTALAYTCCICKQYLLYWHRWYFFKAAGPRSAGGGLPERKWMAAEASEVLSLLLKRLKFFFTFVRRASSLSRIVPLIVVLAKVILHRMIFSPALLRSHAPSDCFRPTTGDRTHPDERNLRSHTLHESRTINHPRPRSRTPPYISSSPSPLLALGEHRRVAPATASSTRRHQVILEPLLLCSSTIFFLLIYHGYS